MYEDSFFRTIPADISQICPLVKDVISYFNYRGYNIKEDIVFDVKVILNELLVNAIVHGSCCDNTKEVDLEIIPKNSDSVVVKIRDHGTGFKYVGVINKEENDCFSQKNNMKECGRGLLIVLNLCESVSFNEEGNEIAAVLRLS